MKKLALCIFAFAAAAPAPVVAQSACSSPEHHQFDFWIGRWNVSDSRSGQPAGSSLIESLYDGCVLRENWSSPGFDGGSLNIYDASDGKWHQVWVDQRGARREFVGGLQGGKMVMVTPSPIQMPLGRALVRMTFTHNQDGSVRQYSDYSKDDGATWSVRYDLLYKRAS